MNRQFALVLVFRGREFKYEYKRFIGRTSVEHVGSPYTMGPKDIEKFRRVPEALIADGIAQE